MKQTEPMPQILPQETESAGHVSEEETASEVLSGNNKDRSAGNVLTGEKCGQMSSSTTSSESFGYRVKKNSNALKRLALARSLAEMAIKVSAIHDFITFDKGEYTFQHKKVFAVEGSFPSVRQQLLSRGWVENLESNSNYKKLAAGEHGLWGIIVSYPACVGSWHHVKL